MSKLIIMIGLPGSGKSTKVKQLGIDVILSSDTYRKKLYGSESDQTHNEEIFKALYSDLRTYLSEGTDCIFDATNTSMKARKRIFDAIKGIKGVKVIAYVMTTPAKICAERDAARSRSVGPEVISKYIMSFQFPQKFEGFNEIVVDGYTKCPYANPHELEETWEDMLGFDQHNPHHAFNLGTHCMLVALHYDKDPVRYAAGLLHDIGKRFTRHFDEKGIAHYYGHDSIGTYYLLDKLNVLALDNWDDIYECLFYINYHMRAHRDFRGTKAMNKYRALFGERLFNNLIEFVDHDIEASGTSTQREELKKKYN